MANRRHTRRRRSEIRKRRKHILQLVETTAIWAAILACIGFGLHGSKLLSLLRPVQSTVDLDHVIKLEPIVIEAQETEVIQTEAQTEPVPASRVFPLAMKEEPETETETEAPTEPETEPPVPTRTYFTVYEDGWTATLSHEMQDWLYEMCATYGIEGYESLLFSILYVESCFQADTIHYNPNGTADYGMAQINTVRQEELIEKLGIDDFMSPYQSIRCGAYVLAKDLERNMHNAHMACVAYNMGQGAVNAGITETSYSDRVVWIRENLIREEYPIETY